MRLTFHVPHARSLKDKRAVIRKFRDRIRGRFEVSIAEVSAQDLCQRGVFGVAVVSGDSGVCQSVLEQIARMASLQEEAVLVDRVTELMPFSDDLFGNAELE